MAPCLSGAALLVGGAALVVVTEPRWPTERPIAYWIQAGPASERYRELVRRALQTWSEATRAVLRFEEQDAPPARGIRIFFVPAHGHFGSTFTNTGVADTIERADVLLGNDPEGDTLQMELVVYLTALHELGHALGLSHSDRFGEIMYGFRWPADPMRTFYAYRKKLHSAEDIGSTQANGLSEPDRRAIRALYPIPKT